MRTRGWHPAIIAALTLLMLCATAQQASAQLNEHCVVSVLNRTVKVNADGTWVLPNIPANSGRVKARATCVERGVTRFGESGFFTIPKNGTVNLPKIVLGTVSSIPTALTLTPAPFTFTGVGQTAQLVVTAKYPDGTTRNVAAASAGTDYTVSNSAIATVSSDGLVTAVASGSVVIQAINEGTPGMAMAKVVLSSVDTDGDGIPDDVEIALGLDPRNPVDALEDFDRDNLTNLEEYRAGTDIRNPDSDGDGLLDGDEVKKYGTNPLIADTDGDLIPDGVEVRTGTNPLDRNSYDLKKATASSTVEPSSFLLTTNPLLSRDVSQQLTWQVRLIDGKTTLDLTADPRTNYLSSDLAICNFGADPGRVFAGQAGGCRIDLRNSTLTATVFGTVKSFAPTALSYVDMPGFANNVDVSGDYAYVASGAAGLQIVDVTNRAQPHIVASRALPGNANDVVVSNHVAYVAAGSAGLQIVNVTNPLAPAIAGAISTGNVAWDVVVKGNRAYVANGPGGLFIVDVSSPAAPVRLGSIALPGTSKGVDVDPVRNIAVVARGTGGFSVVDVANPSSPTVLSALAGGDVRDVAVSGMFAFLADYERSFTAVDLTVPTTPVIAASTPFATGGRLQDVAVIGGIAAGADVFFVNGVPMVDVTDPANPIPRAILNFANFRDDNGTGIALDASFVYMTGERGVDENGVSAITPTRLYIGQYRSDDVTPPTVIIQSPAPGASVIEGSTLQVTVNATDNFAVASVSVLLNNQVVATSTTAPYQLSITIPVTETAITLTAQATDFAGNVGTSADVRVAVTPDTEKPSVRITSPTAPLAVPEGTVIHETVDASDNVAVTRVEFLLNDMIVATKTAPPFDAFITLPIGPPTFRFGARAVDPAGNVGLASEVIVNATADPPPTVCILSPTGGTFTEGQLVHYVLDATDNGAVISTEFDIAVNGQIVYRDLLNQRQGDFQVPIGFSSITLLASATDNLGQVGTSQPVVLTVLSEPAPVVRFLSPASDATLIAGSTIPVVVDATDDGAISGVLLEGIGGVSSPPYQFLVTVPAWFMTPNLNLRAVAIDNIGKSTYVDLSLPVTPDPLTTLQGTIVDPAGRPAAGADVVANLNGLTAEFFRWTSDLRSLPDLTSVTPDFVKLISTLNFNGQALDPFGINLDTTFARDPITIVRLRGTLKVPIAGSYTFSLRSYPAGRLTVNGTRLIDLANVDFAETQFGTGTISLAAGDVPVEVINAASFGAADILLKYTPPAGVEQGIALNQLTPAYSPYRATAAADGTFTIAGVPTVLGNVGVSATLTTADGSTLTGQSGRAAPVAGDTTDLGSIQLSEGRRYVSEPISVLPIRGFANAVDVSGDYAFVAAGSAGLQIVQISDAEHPFIAGSIPLPGNANDVRVVDGLAYVAAGTAGLHILNVVDPSQPSIVGSVATGGEALDVAVGRAFGAAGRAYVANGASGLAVVDVSSPQQPVLLGTVAVPGIAKGVDISQVSQLAVVAAGLNGIAVIDASDVTNLRVVGTLPGGDARDVAVAGETAFVAKSSGLAMIALGDPFGPVLLTEVPGALAGVKMSGSLAVAAGFQPSSAGIVASILDVRHPANPGLASDIDFSSLPVDIRPAAATGVATDGTFVYATASTDASVEKGVDGTTYLYIGQYVVPEDRSGVPPLAFINGVYPGAYVSQVAESRLLLSVFASDNVGLAEIRILVNGQPAATVATASSRVLRQGIVVSIPTDETPITLTVEATDVGNNVSSQTFTVNVLPYLPSANIGIGFTTPPSSLATDGSSVWITVPDDTYGYPVSKFRAADAQFLFRTSVFGRQRTTFVVVDGQQNAWISGTSSDSVVELSPDGNFLREVSVASPGHLVSDGDHVWVVSGSFQIVKINAADGAILGTFPTGGLNPGPLMFDGSNIWIANRFQNTVAKMRASDGALLGAFPTGANVSGIVFDGANVWTANRDDNTLSKIRASDGVTLAVYPTGNGPTGIAFDGRYLWVTNSGDDNASKIRASDGVMLGTIFTGPQPTAVVFGGQRLWIANSGSRSVFVYQ